MSGADRGANKRLLRSAGAMTVMTTLSRVLGLVREQVRGNLLGTGMGADAFAVAAMIPNLFRRLFAEGAMTAAFVPVFSETMRKEEPPALWLYASRFLTLLTLVVTLVTLAGILLAPWIVEWFFAKGFAGVEGKAALTVVLMQITWPYLALISVAAIYQGILNSFRVFTPSAFTPVLLNLAVIGCAAGLSHLFPDPSYAFAVGYVVGGLLQVGFQIPFALRVGVRLRPRLDFWSPRVRMTLRIMLPGVFAAGVHQLNVFVAQAVAAGLHDGSVSSLQYSTRLQELVLGVFVVSVATVILPTMSAQVADGDHKAARSTLRFSFGLLALVTLPATAGLILLGPYIVQVLFQHGAFNAESTRMTSYALLFHALAMYPIAAARVTQQAFFAFKDLRTPMFVGVVSMLVNVALCFALPLLFSKKLALGGVAAAGALAALTNAALLAFFLRRRLGPMGGRALLASFVRLALAAGGMALSLWALVVLLDLAAPRPRWQLILEVAGVGLGGLLIFVGLALALGSPELRELKAIVLRKLRRGSPSR